MANGINPLMSNSGISQSFSKQQLKTTQKIDYIDRLNKIGGMFPAGNKLFYSRQGHTDRVIGIAEQIQKKFFPDLNLADIKEFGRRHDLGRMPFIHYMDIFLKKIKQIKYDQKPFREKHMLESGLGENLANLSILLDITEKVKMTKNSMSLNNHNWELNVSSQTVRLLYYADKLAGYIEDTMLGYKLGYFDTNVPENVAIKNGLPQVFVDALALTPSLIKDIQSGTRNNFNNVAVKVAENFLSTVKTPATRETFEDLIFNLNDALRKGVMEPIIFVKQRQDIGFEHLCNKIFAPILKYLLQNNLNDDSRAIEILLNMTEEDLINLAVKKLNLGKEVEQYQARLSNIQSRWKIE